MSAETLYKNRIEAKIENLHPLCVRFTRQMMVLFIYKNVNNKEKTSEITRLQRLIEQVSIQRGAETSLSYYRRKLYDLRGFTVCIL